MPLFSIITPSFQCGAKIERTIQSVLAQDSTLFDYRIVDGGSTDETLSVIRPYQSHLHCVSGPDRGVYDAMNKGWAAATGDYLLFLGAGDTIVPGILARIAPLLPRSPLTLAYGNAELNGYAYDGKFDRLKLCLRNICHQAIFYSRQLFTHLGGYDLRFPLLADWEFNLRCFGHPSTRIVFLPHTIAHYEGGGLSSAEDATFRRAKPRLIRRHLGWSIYVRWQSRTRFPQLHALLGSRKNRLR